MRYRRTELAELRQIVEHLTGADKVRALRRLLDRPVENSQGWYVLGLEMLKIGDLNTAARAFGMAYHQDVKLTPAAVFTFACLKAAREASVDVRDQFIQTWLEMKKPPLNTSGSEMQMARLLKNSKSTDETAGPMTAADYFDQFVLTQ